MTIMIVLFLLLVLIGSWVVYKVFKVFKTAQNESATANADAVSELQKYKALLDVGMLTEEEFAAKKRQLLGN